MKQEIIYTDDYALIVSDEEIKEGDCYLSPSGIWFYNHLNPNHVKECKKVIAHRPLKDAAILEGVALLPEFSEEEDVYKITEEMLTSHPDFKAEGFSDYQNGRLNGLIDGYNKAKETYKYTEEDLIKAFKAGHSGAFVKEHTVPHYKEYIQFLQPKRPKYFECEIEDTFLLKNRKGGNTIMAKPKTITNSQGQTELVGKYIF
jgi:hypothetical protein